MYIFFHSFCNFFHRSRLCPDKRGCQHYCPPFRQFYKADTENTKKRFSRRPRSERNNINMQTSGVFIMQSADQSQARTAGIILVMPVRCVRFLLPALEKRAVGILLSEIKLAVIKFA